MKQRLDVLLVEQGLAASREKAKAMIMSGVVFVNGQREDKAGSTFDEQAATTIEIHGSTLRYVSRGGLKLEKAVEQFGFSLKDRYVWMSALPREDLRIVCFRMEQERYFPWMLEEGSLTGS